MAEARLGEISTFSILSNIKLSSGNAVRIGLYSCLAATQKAAFMRSFSAAVSVVTMAYTYAFIFPVRHPTCRRHT